jgi:hypothetical protein
VLLESFKIGYRRYTTVEAVARFQARVLEARDRQSRDRLIDKEEWRKLAEGE